MEPYQQREYNRDGTSQIIGAIDFDYDALDQHLLAEHDPENEETRKIKSEWEREGRSSASADLLKLTLEALLPANGFIGTTSKALGLRCVCLLWMLQSDKHDMGNKSLATLAGELKVSRAILSFHVRSLEEQLGFFHARGQKAVEARESYKASVQAGWETRRALHGTTGRKAALHPEKAAKRSGENPTQFDGSGS